MKTVVLGILTAIVIPSSFSADCDDTYQDAYDSGYAAGLAEGRAAGRRAAMDCVRSMTGTAAEAAEDCE